MNMSRQVESKGRENNMTLILDEDEQTLYTPQVQPPPAPAGFLEERKVISGHEPGS
jgi:hypothetical protein